MISLKPGATLDTNLAKNADREYITVYELHLQLNMTKTSAAPSRRTGLATRRISAAPTPRDGLMTIATSAVPSRMVRKSAVQ